MTTNTRLLRRGIAAVALSLIATMLAACGGGSDSGDEDKGEIVIASWGGDFTKSTKENLADPFTADTGIKVKFVTHGNGPVPMALLQAENKKVSIDVIDGANLAPLLTADALAPVPDDLAKVVEETSIDGALIADSIIQYANSPTLIACNADKVETCPTNAQEFWDVKGFPGRRGIVATTWASFFLGLQASGVPAADLEHMNVKDPIDRAISKLEEIKPEIKAWPDTRDRQIQAIVNGQVDVAYIWASAATAAKERIPNLQLFWPSAVYQSTTGLGVMKDAPNQAAAFQFIEWVLKHPEAQAKVAESQGLLVPTRDLEKYLSPEAAENLLTSHEGVVAADGLWIGDNLKDLEEAWNAFIK